MRLHASIVVVALAAAPGACSTGSDEPPIQPVVIKSETFCTTMKRLLPPSGKPSWDVVDSRQTINDARRVGAAVDKNCETKKK